MIADWIARVLCLAALVVLSRVYAHLCFRRGAAAAFRMSRTIHQLGPSCVSCDLESARENLSRREMDFVVALGRENSVLATEEVHGHVRAWSRLYGSKRGDK